MDQGQDIESLLSKYPSLGTREADLKEASWLDELICQNLIPKIVFE
jgi:hypothetical protein